VMGRKALDLGSNNPDPREFVPCASSSLIYVGTNIIPWGAWARVQSGDPSPDAARARTT